MLVLVLEMALPISLPVTLMLQAGDVFLEGVDMVMAEG